MAPEIALECVKQLQKRAVVLDPMVGSGTVIRQAAKLGRTSIGFDLDPLAVLMSRVATVRCDIELAGELADFAVAKARELDGRKVHLSWIDNHQPTREFVNYWFASEQKVALRKLARVLRFSQKINRHKTEQNFLLLALSRVIVTKSKAASLARDTSHSRPHRVSTENDFDVFSGFTKSVKRLKKIVGEEVPIKEAKVEMGDARNLVSVQSRSIDAVITSPPYLNAIDYMRGHRLSLVWMGQNLSHLKSIRSNSIGAERKPDDTGLSETIKTIMDSFGATDELPGRYQGMIQRYALDIHYFTREISRVLKKKGRATLVVGDSTLQGVFIQNSKAIVEGAAIHGLRLIDESSRSLPDRNRYLPIIEDNENALSKRMRTENVLTFDFAA